jgi:hypothetical protein
VKWEMHVRMTLEPAVVLGLVGIEVVEDDMDGRVRMSADDIIHEVQRPGAGEVAQGPERRTIVRQGQHGASDRRIHQGVTCV